LPRKIAPYINVIGFSLALPLQFSCSATASAESDIVSREIRRTPDRMLIASHVRVSVPRTCNSVVFSQLPTDRDHFIGRIGKNGGTCADVNPKSLALFQMNWGASTLHFERYILTPPLEIAAKGETYRASKTAQCPADLRRVVATRNRSVKPAFGHGGNAH
jgi:hypothetical protein